MLFTLVVGWRVNKRKIVKVERGSSVWSTNSVGTVCRPTASNSHGRIVGISEKWSLVQQLHSGQTHSLSCLDRACS